MKTHYQRALERVQRKNREESRKKREKIKNLHKISKLFIACGNLWERQAKVWEKEILEK